MDAGLSRLLNRLASPLCFAPPGLLLAAIALYPYARSMAEVHSHKELAHGYVKILSALSDFRSFAPVMVVWVAQMFWPSLGCVVVALAASCLLWWLRNRTRRDAA